MCSMSFYRLVQPLTLNKAGLEIIHLQSSHGGIWRIKEKEYVVHQICHIIARNDLIPNINFIRTAKS